LNPIQVLLAKPSGTDSDQLVPKRFPITWSVNLILFQRKKSEWVLTPKCIKPSTNPPEKQLQSKSSTKPKCQQKRSKKRDLRSTSIKDFSTPTSPEFMSSSRTTKKCTFSWNCVRMGNFLTSSITMDRFLKDSQPRFSKRFCQPSSTWNRRGFSIETSSAKTFFLIKIGMLNLWISDLLPNNRMKNLVEHFVGLLPTQLQNSLRSPNIRLKLWISGV